MRVSRAQASSAAVTPVGMSATTLRQRNSRAVLDIVRASPNPLRVAEIARAAGLSRPTVETVAEGLEEQGWLRLAAADDTAAPTVGRPARFYRFNERAGFVLGIDIGAHSTTVALADLLGGVIAMERRSTEPDLAPRDRLRLTDNLIGELARGLDIAGDSILATTIGTPGVVPPFSHRVGISPGMPGWTDVDLVSALAGNLGCPIELENDANLAAVGERVRGVGAGCPDMVFLLLGERLGAGIIANDALVRGKHGAAGELGYVPTRGTSGRDLRFGPLESRVNAAALVQMGRRAASAHPDSVLAKPKDLTAQTITTAATSGDKEAALVVRRLAARIAEGVAPTLLTLNPELLVVGGGVSLAGEVLRTALETQIQRLVLFPPDIRLSALGDEAVVLGAVSQALQRVESDVLSHVVA